MNYVNSKVEFLIEIIGFLRYKHSLGDPSEHEMAEDLLLFMREVTMDSNDLIEILAQLEGLIRHKKLHGDPSQQEMATELKDLIKNAWEEWGQESKKENKEEKT